MAALQERLAAARLLVDALIDACAQSIKQTRTVEAQMSYLLAMLDHKVKPNRSELAELRAITRDTNTWAANAEQALAALRRSARELSDEHNA